MKSCLLCPVMYRNRMQYKKLGERVTLRLKDENRMETWRKVFTSSRAKHFCKITHWLSLLIYLENCNWSALQKAAQELSGFRMDISPEAPFNGCPPNCISPILTIQLVSLDGSRSTGVSPQGLINRKYLCALIIPQEISNNASKERRWNNEDWKLWETC